MKNLKITKGSVKLSNAQSQINIYAGEKYFASTHGTRKASDAELIKDAFSTANKCGKLPSELLAERDESLEALQNILKKFEYAMPNYGEDEIEQAKLIINKTLVK